jgi:hypothetical protein
MRGSGTGSGAPQTACGGGLTHDLLTEAATELPINKGGPANG